MFTLSLPMYLMLYMAVDLDALPAPSVSGTALPAVHRAMVMFQSAMMPFLHTKAREPQASSRRRSLRPGRPSVPASSFSARSRPT